MTIVSGARLGPYEIVELVGRGGMGEVYRAIDGRLGRQVAIKVLPSHLAADAESLTRFRREARAVAAISHPNIVAIFDIGNQADTPFVVTELLDGETLRARLGRGRMDTGEALRIAGAIAEGLAAAHEKGIIHRDLKPENVMLTAAGGVKILDFGLASTRRASAPAADSLTHTDLLTMPGVVMGTIGYTSPEQLRGRPITEASDIFSFGCVAYEMLVGAMPFRRDSNLEVIASILLDEPFHLESSAGVPNDVRELIERCLAKNPAARFQHGGDLAAAVREVNAAHDGQFATTAPISYRWRRNVSSKRLVLAGTIALLAIASIATGLFVMARRNRVIDGGYDLRISDVTGSAETRRLAELALRADASGNRSEAIELFGEAARLDTHAPLPTAFLSSFTYYNGDTVTGNRWMVETKRRVPYASSTYETLLTRYLLPDNDSETEMALSSSILELRPSAWRLRLSLAHQHLSRRELPAALAQLKLIDVSAPDDRRRAIVLADRASTGDIEGAKRELARGGLAWRPELLEYARGRIAWSGGQPAEAARQFESSAEHATISNFSSVAIDAGVLAGIARIGSGDLDAAQSKLDVVAVRGGQAKLSESESEAYAFGAYTAWRRSDLDGMRRRLRLAFAAVDHDSAAEHSLQLFALRAGVEPPAVPASTHAGDGGIQSLVDARRAWAHGDSKSASALLARSYSEGVAATWFSEEASLLAYDLGGPPQSFRADPPYPNRLRFIAIWELGRPRRAPPAQN